MDLLCTPDRFGHLAKTKLLLVPPKPKELDIATSKSSIFLPSSHTKFTFPETSVSTKFMFGGSSFESRDMTVKTASTAPAAPRRWPTEPFVDETHGLWEEARPKREEMACCSILSPSGVDVACALM